MQTNDYAAQPVPWYRHRWTWGLMAGPAIVLVAGAVTMVLAIRSDDGLVARDYYKRGLMINRVLKERAEHGAEQREPRNDHRPRCPNPALAGGKECRND